MKLKIKIGFLYLAAGLILSLSGCLKDNIVPVENITLESSALILRYLEGHGDYINSDQMPSVVSPDEVFNNHSSYLILDVRTKEEYSAGHIPGAFNVSNDSLLIVMNAKQASNFAKVIIVSKNGQSASYYTCLLRLYGYNNVYALLFGMGEWNRNFSADWVDILGDYAEYKYFDNTNYRPNKMSQLPSVSFKGSSGDVESKVKDRISGFLSSGFKADTDFINFSELQDNTQDYYIVCYGKDSLYFHGKEGDPGSGHFSGTVYYNPAYDIKSSFKLQTFPPNRKIVIYSTSGHLSAFLTAYLRVLGYDAKTLYYGACDVFYSYLKAHINSFTPFVFLESRIRNYPYNTGNEP